MLRRAHHRSFDFISKNLTTSQGINSVRKMATASRVQLTTHEQPAFSVALTPDTARLTSELLQENHDRHHIFFNKDGFHDHIAHHLLTTFALNASPKQQQGHYDSNKGYQRPLEPLKKSAVSEMHDPSKLKSYLGKEQYYHDFLLFFQQEMDNTSWQDVVNQYLFSGNDLANDMLARLMAGFLHPIIHLGFGIEFEQPAIIAEGLAQAAVHDNYMRRFFEPTEKAVEANRSKPSKTMADLLDAIHDDKELREAPRWSDGNKLRDGIMARASDRIVSYACQWHVKPSELEEKTAEMINAAAYFTGGAQKPGKAIKYDFFYMHCVNCSIFFSSFLKQSWLSDANKCRLLEWKVWNDLAMYASRKCPDIRLEDVRSYQPKQPSGWDRIIDRVKAFEDDGHGSKLVRALAHGQQACAPYEDREAFRVKHDDWLQLGHMAIDSVEAGDPHWVRSAGFDEAWEKIPDRAHL